MNIAIVADIHDNEPYVTAFLSSLQADALLLCGDIGNKDTLKRISVSFNGTIYFVFGNADTFDEKDIPNNIINLGEAGIIELADKKIGLCHEPYKIKSLLFQKPYIIFYGHTHRPWFEEREKVLVINPGALGSTPSTYALWDTSLPAPELKTVHYLKN
jgi:putative phosphoesterase